MTDSSGGWLANSVRFVFFPASPTGGLDIWRPLFGTEPDAEEVRPREGFKRQAGPYRSGQVEISITPVRIDIVLSPRPEEIQPSIVPQLVSSSGSFVAEQEALSTAVRDWLPRCGISILRIAVSGTALHSATSVDDAYSVLASYIKSLRVLRGVMRDLSYRVNWTVKSNTSDVGSYNRITTWTAIMFALQGFTGFGSMPVDFPREHFACLELDINTPAERQVPLAPESLVAIFNDLLHLASENLERGECPTDA